MKINENEHHITLLIYNFAGQEQYYIMYHLFLGRNTPYLITFGLSKYEPNFLDKKLFYGGMIKFVI